MRRFLICVSMLFCFTANALAEQFVLIGSWFTNDVRRYRLDGTFVDIFIPAGTGGLGTPDGLSFGADGNLYVSSVSPPQVLRFNGTSGAHIPPAFATENLLRGGYNTFGPNGNLFVCNALGQHTVNEYDGQNGAFVRSFSAPELNGPAGLFFRDGTMYVSGFSSGQISRFDLASGTTLGPLSQTFTTPMYMRQGSDGDLWISEFNNSRFARYNLTTGGIDGFVTQTGLSGPVGQTVLPDGTLLVTSWRNSRVYKFGESNGAALGIFTTGVGRPNDIIVTPVPEPAAGMTLVGVALLMRRRDCCG